MQVGDSKVCNDYDGSPPQDLFGHGGADYLGIEPVIEAVAPAPFGAAAAIIAGIWKASTRISIFH